jgi:uncharacterized protein YecA (UPF0149 family)
MNNDLFSLSIYDDQMQMEERELSVFVRAVTELYGPERARISEKEWLDESDLLDDPPRSEIRNWHSVTIAASARLADRSRVTLPEWKLAA